MARACVLGKKSVRVARPAARSPIKPMLPVAEPKVNPRAACCSLTTTVCVGINHLRRY